MMAAMDSFVPTIIIGSLQIHVVSEKRLYSSWGEQVSEGKGIIHARRVLNELHARLAKEGYSQV